MKILLAVFALIVVALIVAGGREGAPAPQSEPAAVATASPLPVTLRRTVSASSASFTRMATAFAAHAAPPPEAALAIAEARAGHIDPVELGRSLRAAGSGRELLEALVQERSPEIALQLARTLAGREDDEALRTQTIAALRAAPEARRVGLLALLGRGDADALQLAADTLAGEGDPEERATAAFVLHNAPVAALPGEAYAAARDALRDPGAGARLREEAATLLGRPGASGADLDLLEARALDDVPAVRMRALAALDVAGDPRLSGLCSRIASDASAPDRLAQMARAWSAAQH